MDTENNKHDWGKEFAEICLNVRDKEVSRISSEEMAEITSDAVNEIYYDNSIDEEDFVDSEGTADDPIIPEYVDGNAVVSKTNDGEPNSRFKDMTWQMIDEGGRATNIKFGTDLKSSRTVNFNDPLAGNLTLLHKLLVYNRLPENNRSRKPISHGGLDFSSGNSLLLLDWLYENGILLGKSRDSLIPLSDLSAKKLNEALRSMVEKCGTPEQTVSAPGIKGLTYVLRNLCDLSKRAYCPPELKVPFSYNDVIDWKLAKDIGEVYAKRIGRWRAIDFEVLEKMTKAAQNYIELYAPDILFMLEQYNEACKSNKEAGQTGKPYMIDNKRHRKAVFDNISERIDSFAINPETNETWWEPVAQKNENKGHIYSYYQTNPIRQRRSVLAGACVFIGLLFTGQRSSEMDSLTTSSLRLNGKPLDLDVDGLSEVIAAGKDAKFELQRIISKIDDDNPGGRSHVVPIPPMTARAIAILGELFRQSRKWSKTDKLIPSRMSHILPHEEGVVIDSEPVPKYYHSHTLYLSHFCDHVGVPYQSPHKARKSLATLIINDDPTSLDVIMHLLGHKSRTMTYVYIMSLPGINEALKQHMLEQSFEDIVHILIDGEEGKLAGGASDRALDAILQNKKHYQGKHLLTTTKVLLDSVMKSEFRILRTPASWCLRHPSNVPRTAPCLPLHIQKAIQNGTLLDDHGVHVNPEHCNPQNCGDSLFTTRDKENARRQQQYATQRAANSGTSRARAEYQDEADYWAGIVDRLENGRADFRGLRLLEKAVKELRHAP